jgi:hypothetical protein
MPVTVKDIFSKVGLEPSAAIKWKGTIPTSKNGVYVVSLSADAAKNKGIQSKCEVSEMVFNNWKELSPELNVNGIATKAAVETELNQFWKPTENILYVGESSSETNGLSKRVNQFYQHEVGWKGPHTGGYWIKLLSKLEDLYVYYAQCDYPRDTEFKMLMYFIEQTTGKSFYELKELGKHLPFANLKVDFQKQHLISNAVQKRKKK